MIGGNLEDRILLLRPAGTSGSHDSVGCARRGEMLTWQQRLGVIVGAARGLAYLHSSDSSTSKPPILHRDVKAANILLGVSCVASISRATRVLLVSHRLVPCPLFSGLCAHACNSSCSAQLYVQCNSGCTATICTVNRIA